MLKLRSLTYGFMEMDVIYVVWIAVQKSFRKFLEKPYINIMYYLCYGCKEVTCMKYMWHELNYKYLEG